MSLALDYIRSRFDNAERGFSILTGMMSDRRLSLKHETLEDLLMVKVNHGNWTEQERNEILQRALDSYMSTRRKVQLEVDSEEAF